MRRGVRLPLDALSPYLLELNGRTALLSPPAADGSGEPSYGQNQDTPSPLSWRTIFGNDHPVEIEVGFGKGLFLLTSATARPDTNFLGMEIERKYTLYTANRLAKRQLRNVRVCCGDARAIFELFVPESSVQALHIFFPDPWWKKKHRKRRLFSDPFAQACVRCLRIDGRLHVVSDVAEYYAEITELLGRQQHLRPVPPTAESQPRHDVDFLTNFERKYRQEGRAIHHARYVKV